MDMGLQMLTMVLLPFLNTERQQHLSTKDDKVAKE
jgi:hypothetical protein